MAAAKALITAEAASGAPPAVAPSAPSFSPVMATEMDRVASKAPLVPLDLKRYEAQDLPAKGSPDETSDTLAKAYTSSAYLSSRLQNLQLLEKHGAHAWLLSNYHLEATLRDLEKDLAATKRQIDEVNAARGTRQQGVKGEIETLEETWQKGVARVLETEVAVEELKAKIREELRNRAATGAS